MKYSRIFFWLLLCIVVPTNSVGAESHTIEVDFSFNAPDDPARQLLGYRLYKEAEQVCETSDPSASKISCTFLIEEGTYDFSLTAYYSDGTESPRSPSFPFTIVSTQPEDLQAVITATPTTGTVPVEVSLSAADSTGDITTYTWNFGDGTSDTGLLASHTFPSSGTYTVTLTVADQTGATHETSTTITALPNITSPDPPVAAISLLSAEGDLPMLVTLNGAASTSPNLPIASYTWTFGDGSQATGETVSHSFESEGTFTLTLTVIDSAAQTAQTSTQVVVSAGSSNQNQPPTASFTMTSATGTFPLVVSFDASGSSDPDSAIYDYAWNFGDGTTGFGVSAEHTFSEPGAYTVTLTVMDDWGETATVSRTVSLSPADEYQQEKIRRTINIINTFLLMRPRD